MFKNIRVILATIALILAIFSLFANIPILLSFVFILFGIDEIKKQEKAFVYFLGSVFVLYVGVSSILS
ncbi:DUF3953 domain-containing protein [Bacillus thuringiensis]|uniref:DUF3953 domain-containing protein n=1 Tax=Bacillus thuringiensis TaxID=1428 RepID=UPI001EDDCC53|nr:DUF3953 domain-containing protein [Bacillus thuringiensis]MCG3424600.1 DUF3953 domain-containing protein [Bacillus thuringiensis]